MRLLKWSLLFILILPALWFGLVLTHWLPRLSAEQEAALATVAEVQQQSLGERNAYPLLWLFKYDVPIDQIDAVMEEDLARFAEYEQDLTLDEPYVSVAEQRYGELPALKRPAQGCYDISGDCLADVRANRAAVAEELLRQSDRLAREAMLNDYDHVAVRFPKSLRSPLLMYYGSGGTLRAAAAHDHLEGRSEPALQRLCQHSSAWRRFRQRGDTLIIDMLGIAAIQANARLAAQILAERPDLDQLPCLSVFAPLSDAELTQCTVMVGEYSLQEGIYQALQADASGALDKLQYRMLNAQHTRSMMAQSLAYYCQEPHRQRVAARRTTPPIPEFACDWVEQTFNPIGCIMAAIARPAYGNYYARALDLDARLKLFEAARWLRANEDGAPLAQRLEGLPESMRSPEHAFTVSASAQIQVKLLQPRDSEYWVIPVRQQAPASEGPEESANLD